MVALAVLSGDHEAWGHPGRSPRHALLGLGLAMRPEAATASASRAMVAAHVVDLGVVV
ncbi:MAG TPA: hypothetical protein VE152_01175 [Acidimicrobiales bacterium]|nr:hypothetical protein [Acidimicrobiales bacterium]